MTASSASGAAGVTAWRTIMRATSARYAATSSTVANLAMPSRRSRTNSHRAQKSDSRGLVRLDSADVPVTASLYPTLN
jgi:hypothetical protein